MLLKILYTILGNTFSNKLFVWIISVVQLFFCFLYFRSQQTDNAYINLLIYWFILLLYSISIRQNGVILMAFLISFFTFLLGRDFFLVFFGIESSDIYLFTQDCVSHMYFCMNLSLFGIFIGHSLFKNQSGSIKLHMDDELVASLKKVVLKLFNITLIFKILEVVLNVYNFLILGSRGYHNIWVLEKLVQINYLMFLGYLLLAPSKKELLPVLKVYLGIQLLTFLTGTRGEFLYFAFMLFCYLLYRDYVNKLNKKQNEVFITKKMWVIIACIAPFFVIFLGLFASIRLGEGYETTGFSNDLNAFFVQQGGSAQVIGYAKYYENSFPTTNISYTFGPLINYIKYGVFGSLLGNKMPSFEQIPMYGNNMGATITWLISPEYYYNGGGQGNQYIAELYKDFGYWGVFFFSVLLGIIIRGFLFFSTKSWTINVLFAFGLQNVISMPRDYYLTCLIGVISLLNIIVLLSVKSAAAKRLRKNKLLT